MCPVRTIPGVTGPYYDANGNVIYDGFHHYGWDAEGNLITNDSNTGTFDALNRRVELGSALSYDQMLYPPFAPTYQMSLAVGLAAAGIRMPLPGGGQAIFGSSGLSQYRHPNWQGSQTVMSYASGSPNPNIGEAFTAFGEKYAIYPSGDNGYFAGMLGIANAGAIADAYQATARLYHQDEGRWVSPDPAGMAAVDPMNPQSWNRYAYVMNNPLSGTDPSGLDPHQCPSGQTWVQNQNGDGGQCVNAGSLSTSTWIVVTNCAQAALMYPGTINCGVYNAWVNNSTAGGSAVNCFAPNAFQSAGIGVQQKFAQFVGHPVGFGAGLSGGSSLAMGFGFYGTASAQMMVTPNGNAYLVYSYGGTGVTQNWMTPVKGTGLTTGLQVSSTNTPDPSNLAGPAIDLSAGGGRVWGAGGDLALTSDSNGNLVGQATVTGPFAWGGFGGAGAITNTNVIPSCSNHH